VNHQLYWFNPEPFSVTQVTYNAVWWQPYWRTSIFIPRRVVDPGGGYRFTFRPCVRASVRPCDLLQTKPCDLETSNFDQICTTIIRPRVFFGLLKKFKMADFWPKNSQKMAKNGHFLVQYGSSGPAKTIEPSFFILWHVIIPYNGIMHDILEFWKNPKWPTYSDFKICTFVHFGLTFCLISQKLL
jgi:hypothetical protein